ncbi:MAG: stress response protein, partial [Candidatus Limnocylindria bacterium]
MNRDDSWQPARLIPLPTGSGVEAKERHAASALLAVLSAVDEFGRALLKPLGAPAGKIDAFIEASIKLESGRSVRPDGVIGVTRAGRTWWALVECKIADQQLSTEQMEAYLDVARANGIDAVLSISNQYATRSSDYPIPFDRKKLRKVSIHHWSWVRVLTEAEVQRQYRGVSDPDQAYLLEELIRYLSDPRS